ncbi:MAG: hypothetical protein QF645_09540, partial [Planctomycetota bacterium]|nr:hypothetical protein [Planctomycetota bacterium]
MHGRNFSWRHIVLSFLCAGTLTGCGGVEVGCLNIGGGHTADKPTSNMVYKSLAEQMWELARDISTGSGKGENAAEKLAVWEANKTKFINAFNSFLPKDDAKLFGSTAGEVFAFIDDGTIPQMTDSAASMIEFLYTNPEDPDKRALKGLHALMQQQDSTLDPDATLELLGRLIAHKEFEDFIASIGQVVRENDGVDANGEPNGEKDLLTDLFKMIGEKLEESNVQNSSANNLQGMVEHLLSTRDLPAELDLGDPAWIVEVDDNRNPIVAVDPNTGTLYEPFVDTNLDGEADINADGNHIDTNGDLIDIPAFGRTGCRDEQRRALCEAGGEPIYVYFDGKRTALAGVMMLVGDLLEEDVPRKLRPVAQAMLGTRVNNDNGTPSDPTDDYMHYPEQDNPLLDLVWSVMELTRAPEINDLTDNLGGMNLSESKTSERLVLYTGKVLKAFQEEDFFKEYPDWIKLIDLVDDLLPIADEVFEKPNATSKSTGEILMEVLKDLAD